MIMETKHTKAPLGRDWEIAENISYSSIVVHAHPLRIAKCYDKNYEGLYPNRKEAEANAKLIAAAPDLLEALISVKDYFETYRALPSEETEILNQIESAIKKATE